jgi:hypothetical protein
MSDLRVTNLKGRTAGSAPTLPDGVVITGITTVSSVIVGTGITLSSSGINVSGVITATSFSGNGSGLTGVSAGIGTTGSVNTSGIITATSFFGSGANLTGVAGTSVFAAGSAAAPSISPTGDSNTGIFFPAADTIAFAEGGAEAMRVDSSGRLLVGTSTARSNIYVGGANPVPNVQFESVGNNYNAGLSLINYSALGFSPSLVLGLSLSNTAGTNAAVSADLLYGIINFVGNDGTNFRTGASIVAACDGAVSTGDLPTRLVFSTTADGASSPTERMRIGSDGALSSFAATYNGSFQTAATAGTTYSVLSGWYGATSNGSGGTNSFRVWSNGNVQNTNGSYTTLSDAKLKENIVDAGSQWDDLKAIQIRNWNFKEETGHETHRQIGPIAQELETVCPGLVFETPDRDAEGNETGEVTKGVNQSVLYMKAVKALQEAMERIEQLETSNTDLLARVIALETA